MIVAHQTSFRDPVLTEYPWGCYGLPGKTRDGKLVSVISASPLLSREEREEHLKRYGIRRFYDSMSQWLYTPWPVSMAEEIRNQGIRLLGPSDEGENQLVFSLKGFACRTSTNGGKSWTTRPIEGIPFMSYEAGSFRETIVTQKGTWIASVLGTPNSKRSPAAAEFTPGEIHFGSYALRSEDEGNSWKLSEIAYDPNGMHSFDETSLLELPSGRILAMIRHSDRTNSQTPDRHLFHSYSDDEGKTWFPASNSGLLGFPAHLLLLKSGRILCTFGCRFDPWGHRAGLSFDNGQTWDSAHVKILRDDSLQGWTTYPMSSQLEDGTIFTTYGMVKKAAPCEMPQNRNFFREGKEGRYVYAAASFYGEEFVQPLGRF
jgi:hypothetical protein